MKTPFNLENDDDDDDNDDDNFAANAGLNNNGNSRGMTISADALLTATLSIPPRSTHNGIKFLSWMDTSFPLLMPSQQ